jgi:hypothetical protein
MCSWCQRVRVSGRWVQVEEAVVLLDLMSRTTIPAITHGICEDCQGRIRNEVSALRLAL